MSSKELLKEQKKRFQGKEFLLRGRMLFPALLKPKPDDQGKLKYGMQFFWKDNCQRNKPIMDEMNKLIQEHKEQWYPNHPNFLNPIKHYDTYTKMDGSPNPTFLKKCYWVNAKANKDFAPGVFDSNKKRISDDAELTDGRECLISVNLYPYQFKNTGVAVGLKAVIVLPGGEVPYGGEPVDPDELFSEDVTTEINNAVEKTTENMHIPY